MGTDLQAVGTTAVTVARKSRWCEPLLSVALDAKMREAMSSPDAYLNVVSADIAGQIPEALAAYDGGLAPSSDDEIERMMLKLAVLYPGSKVSDEEAAGRLEVYVELLRDLPFDVLSAAFRAAAQTTKFFPSVAEIRAAAEPAMRERRMRVIALRRILAKHHRDYRADEPAKIWTQAEVDDANAAFRKLGIATRYRLGDGGAIDTVSAAEVDAPATQEGVES